MPGPKQIVDCAFCAGTARLNHMSQNILEYLTKYYNPGKTGGLGTFKYCMKERRLFSNLGNKGIVRGRKANSDLWLVSRWSIETVAETLTHITVH